MGANPAESRRFPATHSGTTTVLPRCLLQVGFLVLNHVRSCRRQVWLPLHVHVKPPRHTSSLGEILWESHRTYYQRPDDGHRFEGELDLKHASFPASTSELPDHYVVL